MENCIYGLRREVAALKAERDGWKEQFDNAMKMLDDERTLTAFKGKEWAKAVARAEALEALLAGRAGKLLKRGTPFFVVKASEPYAAQVVALIKAHEGPKWTDADEAWARAALAKKGG